jgi:hypothetical protein
MCIMYEDLVLYTGRCVRLWHISPVTTLFISALHSEFIKCVTTLVVISTVFIFQM